jgi:hypothetical protein
MRIIDERLKVIWASCGKNSHHSYKQVSPFEERQYCQTLAIYMEGLLPSMKMSMNGKKPSGIPFHSGKIAGNS